MSLKLDGTRFGAIEVDPEKIIEFPRGLPGFESLRRFALLQPEGGPGGSGPAYYILQSVDDPEIAFHIADPGRMGFSYEIALSDADSALIGLDDPAKAAVVVILANAPEGGVRANLNAPLVLNLEAKRGVQHVFNRLDSQVMLKGQ